MADVKPKRAGRKSTRTDKELAELCSRALEVFAPHLNDDGEGCFSATGLLLKAGFTRSDAAIVMKWLKQCGHMVRGKKTASKQYSWTIHVHRTMKAQTIAGARRRNASRKASLAKATAASKPKRTRKAPAKKRVATKRARKMPAKRAAKRANLVGVPGGNVTKKLLGIISHLEDQVDKLKKENSGLRASLSAVDSAAERTLSRYKDV